MISVLSTICSFLIALTVLVACHEFGHFYVARKFKVQVLRFSIGFGKPLLRWKDNKETEFVVCWIPLGGYVKMLGETAEEPISEGLQSHAYCHQSVWVRMAILIAGPLFNFVLAIVALWAMYLIGVTSLAPVIEEIKPFSAAAHASLKKMDKVVQVNNQPVETWREVNLFLTSAIGEDTPVSLELYNLKTRMYHATTLNLQGLTLNDNDILHAVGITPALPPFPPVISKIYKNYPGAKAGLKKGDRVIAVNGKRVRQWFEVVAVVQAMPNQAIVFNVLRDGEEKTITIQSEVKKENGQSYGFIGVESKIPPRVKKMWFKTESYSFWEAGAQAIHQTGFFIKATLGMLGKLLTGGLSLHTISGPIGIAQSAGQAAQLGWAYYFSFIALVSISLGVLNLLPIPVLDGGHLLYCLFEVILRRPLSQKARFMGMQFGFAFLMALMFLAVFNDLTRLLLW